MPNSDLRIATGLEVARSKLNRFLRQVYSQKKSEFLITHGAWLYRGHENQWIVTTGEEIIAYCAVIPTACSVDGKRLPGLWWVDLIVAPAYRGQGIQTRIDERMRAATDLKLGFPNALAAKIHRKHRWGVREDGRTLMLPLAPLSVKAVRNTSGHRGCVLRMGAVAITPVMKALSWRYRHYRPADVRKVDSADPQFLATIFERCKETMPVTTYRDADFIQWRYHEAPYRDKLAFYLAGPSSEPSHCLISRYVDFDGVPAVRILDLFGDFADGDAFHCLLRMAISDAIRTGAKQITALTFHPRLTNVLRGLGFVVGTTGRFCWHSTTAVTKAALDGPQHWTLGDSDNDAPE